MQQINLYTAQFPKPEKIKFSRKWSIVIVIIAITVITGISLSYWKIDSLRKEYAEYKKSVSLSKQALTKIKSELDQSATNDKLKISLLDIKKQLKHKQALKDRLTKESTDISISFYDRFVALSNQDISGLWLTNINFFENGKSITLMGSTIHANLFTQYLQHLSKEPVFSGITFRVIQMDTEEEDKKTRGHINFIISTDELPDESKPINKMTPLQQVMGSMPL